MADLLARLRADAEAFRSIPDGEWDTLRMTVEWERSLGELLTEAADEIARLRGEHARFCGQCLHFEDHRAVGASNVPGEVNGYCAHWTRHDSTCAKWESAEGA